MQRVSSGVYVVVALAALSGVGCSEEPSKADKAMEAASAFADLAERSAEAAEAAGEASKAAEEAAREKIAAGADPEVVKKQLEMAKGMAAMKAFGGGDAVNWRELQGLLPDDLGGFAASGELDGRSQKMGGAVSVTTVKRKYAAGDRSATIEITDAIGAPMLKAPFAMAAMVEEDTTSGYKKGTKIDGHTALVEWRKSGKDSRATLLVGDRFLVNVRVRTAKAHDDAQKLAAALSLGELAAVKPEPKEE